MQGNKEPEVYPSGLWEQGSGHSGLGANPSHGAITHTQK